MTDFDCCEKPTPFRYGSSASVGDPHIQLVIDESGNFKIACASGDPRAAIVLLRMVADDLEDLGEAEGEPKSGGIGEGSDA